ncbi:DNA polymerase III subunit gamma/tau [Rheinheimera riviphila]|uniref:DNA polymerase III subunit gamma/tau n=1 Tax=Rheinheimera riviphila TaxID=1834037 RepID=A0A437R1B4_9GAMM|nr:DNA polymerase III subunit gamma/tau [Rheinheimera riviphila]RVU40513.1 DNA polymerase III subunit gamma/tau [Rheinheimera riviphila]
MSYQVLARKWRPQNFGQLVGQDHVKAALTNALTQNRLHHAYLFTGTRGVGKTTIARIFAKSLNCEQGVTATPCGVCSACVEIDKGYFVDLLEIDAASRTKVEDTRDLLDNVQYAPSRGRYKVYLIDEVHMLSKHSFNALLKTLEEPPPHVKFLLATTDPQKLPITVLSRCLQFSLKALSQSQIKQHLAYILSEEKIAAEDEALALLARAAKGSLRDSLSLTDQAIAQTNGHIELGPVREMLGFLEQSWAELLLQDVLNRDLPLMQHHLMQLMTQHSQVHSVLDDMLSLLHLAALCQFQLSAAELALTESAFVRAVAKSQSAEAIQLYYQLLLSGKKDLPYAPDARTGIEMALLRAIAFVPATPGQDITENTTQSGRAAALSAAGLPTMTAPVASSTTSPVAVPVQAAVVADLPVAEPQTAPVDTVADPATPQIDPITASIIARRALAATAGAVDEKKSERQPAPQLAKPVAPQITVTAVSAAPLTIPTPTPAPAPVTAEEQDDEWQPITTMAVINTSVDNHDPDEEPDPVADSAGGDWAWQQYQADEPSSDPDKDKASASDEAQPIRHALLDSLQVLDQDNTDFSAESVQHVAVADISSQPLYFHGSIDAGNFAVKYASQIDPWAARIDQLAIGGLMRLFLLHASAELHGSQLKLQVMASQRHLDNEKNQQTLQTVLSGSYQQPLTLDIEFCEQVPDCPIAIQQRIDEARRIYVAAVLAADPLVQALQQHFAAELVADSLLVN